MSGSSTIHEEVARLLDRRERTRQARFWLACAFALAILTLISTGISRMAKHASVASQLRIKGLDVDWYLEERSFWTGGASTVSYHPSAHTRYSDLTPEDIKQLTRLSHVETLDLVNYPKFSDDLFASLGELGDLTELRLSHTDEAREAPVSVVTDRILTPISRLTKLRVLSLAGQRITDRQIDKLQSLSELEELDLEHTRITDECLDVVAKLPKLLFFRVTGTKITKEGIARLQLKAPRITVLREAR